MASSSVWSSSGLCMAISVMVQMIATVEANARMRKSTRGGRLWIQYRRNEILSSNNEESEVPLLVRSKIRFKKIMRRGVDAGAAK